MGIDNNIKNSSFHGEYRITEVDVANLTQTSRYIYSGNLPNYKILQKFNKATELQTNLSGKGLKHLKEEIMEVVKVATKYGEPCGIEELLKVPGIGPKKYILLHHMFTGVFPNETLLLKGIILDIYRNVDGFRSANRDTLGFDGGKAMSGSTALEDRSVIALVSKGYGLVGQRAALQEVIDILSNNGDIMPVAPGVKMATIYYHAESWFTSKHAEAGEVVHVRDANMDKDFDNHIAELVANTNYLQIITGAAGHGKSTLTARAIATGAWGNADDILIVAPTGRAADVIKKAIGQENIDVDTSTIHKAYFQFFNSPETYKTLIVDESSMVSSNIAWMIRSIALTTLVERVILIGDPMQCAPVESGNIFSGLCATGNVRNLEYNFRSKKAPIVSGIISDARRVINATAVDTRIMPHKLYGIIGEVLDGPDRKDDWMNLIKGESLKRILSGEVQYISYTNKACDIINILIEGMREEAIKAGMVSKLQKAVMDRISGERVGNPVQYAIKGSRVVLTVNTSLNKKSDHVAENIKLWVEEPYTNGTIFTIKSINGFTVTLTHTEDDSVVKISRLDFLEMFNLAHCLTVHKAQGGGYDRVIWVVSGNQWLNTDVVYTAITRAKSELRVARVDGARDITCIKPLPRKGLGYYVK